MNLLVLALLVAGGMPYALTFVAKAGGFSRADNARTREWQAQLTGWRQRAHWAHQNGFEGYPFYAAAVLAALVRAPGSTTCVALAWGYVGVRVVYSACYIANVASLRTAVFFAGIGCVLGLFVVAGTA